MKNLKFGLGLRLGIFWNFGKDEVDLKQEDNVTTFEGDNQFKIMTGILASWILEEQLIFDIDYLTIDYVSNSLVKNLLITKNYKRSCDQLWLDFCNCACAGTFSVGVINQ